MSAIQFLDNFPVKFPYTPANECFSSNGEWNQLAQFSDQLLCVFKPKTTALSVTNGTFTGSATGWTVGSGWAYTSNKVRLTNSIGLLEQAITHTNNVWHKITFTVSNFSSATSTGLFVVFGGDTYGNYSSTGIVSNGTHTIYLKPTTSGNLQFGSATTSVICDIDNVTVEKVEQCYSLTAQGVSTEVATINKKEYVINQNDGTMSVIDTALGSVEKTISMPSAGLIYGSCFDYYYNKIYIGNSTGCFVYNVLTEAFEDTIVFGSGRNAYDLQFDYTNKYILAASSLTDEVVFINGSSSEAFNVVSVGNQPVAMAIEPTLGKLYVCNYLDDTVSVIDIAAQSVLSTIAAVSSPISITFDSGSVFMAVSSVSTDELTLIDCSTDAVFIAVSGVTDPRGCVYNEAEGKIYVCSYSTNSVIVVETGGYTIDSTIGSITAPVFASIDKQNNKVYISKETTDAVAVIDCSTDTVSTSISVGDKPFSSFSTYYVREALDFTYYKQYAYIFTTWSDILQTSTEGCYYLKINDTCLDWEYLSMPYKLKEIWSCTLALSYFGTYDSFDVPYTQFDWVTYPDPVNLTIRNKYHTMRLQSYLFASKYPAEVSRYIDSASQQKLYYGSNRKEQTMFIVECPEYMHDAIATAFLHDNLYIDGVRRQWLDGSYDPEWNIDNNYFNLAKSRAQIGDYLDENKSVS